MWEDEESSFAFSWSFGGGTTVWIKCFRCLKYLIFIFDSCKRTASSVVGVQLCLDGEDVSLLWANGRGILIASFSLICWMREVCRVEDSPFVIV